MSAMNVLGTQSKCQVLGCLAHIFVAQIAKTQSNFLFAYFEGEKIDSSILRIYPLSINQQSINKKPLKLKMTKLNHLVCLEMISRLAKKVLIFFTKLVLISAINYRLFSFRRCFW